MEQASDTCATVSLALESLPESVALVRAGLKGLGERLELESELLNDLQTAVSEACNNVVLHAYGDRTGPLVIRLEASQAGVALAVRDHGRGLDQPHATEHAGVGLALIGALADRTELVSAADGGTEVRMDFARPIAALRELDSIPDAPSLELPGDVVASVCPASLLGAVLGRLARLRAAQARFSIDRFADMYLVLDSLAAHAQRFATSRGISFALAADRKRLDLRIGPLRRGIRDAVGGPARNGVSPLLGQLVDRLDVDPLDGDEVLCLTLDDAGPASAG